MGDNMETDACSGFKRRITDDHFDPQQQPQQQEEPSSSSFSAVTAQDLQEDYVAVASTGKQDGEPEVIENCPGSCKKVRSSLDEEKEDMESEGGNRVDYCVGVEEDSENGDVGCGADVEETVSDVRKCKEDKDYVEIEEGVCASQELEKFNAEMLSLLDVKMVKENLAVAIGESNGVLSGKEMESGSLLEAEKRRIMTEIEQGTFFVEEPRVEDGAGLEDKFSGCEEVHKIVKNDEEKLAGRLVVDERVRSLKIEVIDDTALIESVLVSKTGNGCQKDIGYEGTAKKIGWKGKKEEKKQDVDGKKVKRSRRKAKDMKRVLGMSEVHKNITPVMEDQDGSLKNGEQSRKVYSREEMEALRFVDIVEQQKLWTAIYTGLGLTVSNQYNELANLKQKTTPFNFDPRQQSARKLEAPGILSAFAARGRRNHFNIFVH